MSNCTIPGDAERLLENQGYFVVENVLDADAVRAVRKEIERIIEVADGRWGGVIVTLPDEMAAGARQKDRPFLLRDGQVCDHPRRGRALAF